MFLAGQLVYGCGRPKPPTLTPEKAEITAVGPAGVHLELHLAVDNPNRIDLAARSVTGKLVLDGKYDVGVVTVAQPFRLTAGQTTRLAVPLVLEWKEIPVLLALAAMSRDLPYDVEGSVNVGGESLNVDLPFHLRGVITHEQLLRATANSLPRLP